MRGSVQITESRDLSLLEGMENKNHLYAFYGDKVYYRQYRAASFQPGGVLKSYAPVRGSEKDMMCILPDGTKRRLFTDYGSGDFYILNDRIYMTELGDYDPSIIYSVNMEGEERMNHGFGVLAGASEAEGLLFLEYTYPVDGEAGGDRNGLYVLDTDTGIERRIQGGEWGSASSFLAYEGGRIYFQETERREIEGEAFVRENITSLYSIQPDGTQKNKLMELAAESVYLQTIRQLQVVDGTVYVSYGGRDGSAALYQGGWLACVGTDGSDFRLLTGPGDKPAGEYFYVHRMGDRILLHYSDMFEGSGIHMVARDVSGGEIVESEFPYSAPGRMEAGRIFSGEVLAGEYGKGADAYVYPDQSGILVKIADSLYERSGFQEEHADSYICRDFAYFDGYLYFTAEASAYDSDYSVGWRDGYRRLRTCVYRMKAADGACELLYSY